ncbi:MAG: M23 family metallopeptidase [Treponema sp.]|nr:M23 family metallopeptidase [Treponema sp.]
MLFFKIFKTRISQILVASIFCFSAGIGCALLCAVSINAFADKAVNSTGVGGYEAVDASDMLGDEALIVNLELAEHGVSPTPDENDSINSQFINPDAITYQTYRVKAGDMIGIIAAKYDVTQDTIISVNNIKQSRLIQVGQYLKIPSLPGIIYTVKENGETPQTIAQKYKVDAEKCASANSVAIEASFSAGTSVFVPDAELDWMTRQEINGDLFKKPLHSRYWLSSPYGWRDSPFNTGKRTFHGGIDMAAASGTPIYASLDGKVTATGYNATYGNYIIITHHSGYKTLYAHLSKINCRKGNFVYTTTKIGEVGSTGMSTGPHLHFTVYKNGKSMNPMSVLN